MAWMASAGRSSSRAARPHRLRRGWVSRLGAVTAVALTGCASPDMASRVAADHDQADTGTAILRDGRGLAEQSAPTPRGSQGDADRRAAEQREPEVVRHARRSWVASVSVPMERAERLPTIFTEPVRLNFEDAASGGRVSLRALADRITALTGVAVRVKPDVYGLAEGGVRAAPPVTAAAAALPVPLPAGALAANVAPLPPLPATPAPVSESSVSAVAMRWSGTLQGFLDRVTDQLSLSWEYRDGVVVIERLRTEFFEIASLEGETDYKLGLSGSDQGSTGGPATSGGGGASNSASVSNEVSERGKSNVIGSILGAINQIIKDVPGSSAVRSEGSGRIAVTTTQETLSKVRDFVRAENESLLRQAQVQFDIFSVTRNEADERGLDWSLLLSALGGAYTANVGSPQTLTGTAGAPVGFSILTPTQSGVHNLVTTHLGGSSALLKLLNEIGTSAQHREVSLLALNRTWDRKSSLGGRAYVSATIPGPSSTTGIGAPGLVTSTVTTGDRYLAQPFILDNNTVLLKFGIGLSSLVNLVNFTSGTGSTEQTVQTPETAAVDDQATVALKAGQVLVITGLSRLVSANDRRTLSEGAPIGLGGSATQSRQREDFVIFVRPTIL